MWVLMIEHEGTAPYASTHGKRPDGSAKTPREAAESVLTHKAFASVPELKRNILIARAAADPAHWRVSVPEGSRFQKADYWFEEV